MFSVTSQGGPHRGLTFQQTDILKLRRMDEHARLPRRATFVPRALRHDKPAPGVRGPDVPLNLRRPNGLDPPIVIHHASHGSSGGIEFNLIGARVEPARTDRQYLGGVRPSRAGRRIGT